MRLVTVATFPTEPEAQLGRSSLAAHGIESFLVDEHIVALDPLASLAYRGVKLQVGEADASTACELLEASDAAADDEAPSERHELERAEPSISAFGVIGLALALLGVLMIVGEPQVVAGWFFVVAGSGTWALGRLRPAGRE